MSQDKIKNLKTGKTGTTRKCKKAS